MLLWETLMASNSGKRGTSASDAAVSAAAIKAINPSAQDGVYWIDLPTVGPTQIYCIMNSAYDGGGWMMAMKATRGTTFNYSSNYWTTANTLNPTQTNTNDGDAKFHTMNYFAAKDIMAVWPDISNSGSESGSIDNLSVWTWLENNFNGGTRQALINFFTSPSNLTYTSSPNVAGVGYFLRDAKTFNGWASGKFSSQVDIRFYGFNYIPAGLIIYCQYTFNARVRWGFGWNENGEGLFPSNYSGACGSNDVSGGIGMDSSYGSYSAGDYIACCNDTTGINRSARVELYVR